MRKLVLILVASIAVITFIRAFDYSNSHSYEIKSDAIYSDGEGIYSELLQVGETVTIVVE